MLVKQERTPRLKEELDEICERLDALEDYLGFEEGAGDEDEDEDEDDSGLTRGMAAMNVIAARLTALQTAANDTIDDLEVHYQHLLAHEAAWDGEAIGRVLTIISGLRDAITRSKL